MITVDLIRRWIHLPHSQPSFATAHPCSMGQKASKPAEASEPAVPHTADAAQQPQTNPVSQPVIKDQTRESKLQETPVTRPVAALPSKPSFQPDPKNSVTSSEPVVTKHVAQQVAPVSAIAKGKSKEQVAEKQVTPKQPVQSKPPAQKQQAQPKQQRQQKPITAQQQKSVSAQQQSSGSSKRSIPQKAATQPQQASPAKAIQQAKPSPQKPQSQQKPSQPQQKPSQPQPQKPTQQPTSATLQKPQAQQKQQPPVILPTKPVKAKKPKQAKQPQQSTLSPNAKLPRKPITTSKTDAPVVGGSLRARMSSPPKLIITEVIVNRDGQGQGGVAPSGVPAPSHAPTGLASTVSISSVSSKSGEKRRLNDEDDLDPVRAADPSVLAHTSPQHRQRKIVRRDGDTDTASAQESDVKSVAAVPEVVVHEEEKEEGEISDEEMEMPPPLSKTSLLDRLSDVHVADSTTSTPHSTSSAVGGSGSLSARMDPALMARIDPRGTPFASSTSNLYGQPPRAPFAPYSAKHSMRNAKPNQPIPGFPNTTPNAPAQHPQTARVADVRMKDAEQPRMKGVVGRSGNQTTVNGVAIPTGKGHGENQRTFLVSRCSPSLMISLVAASSG